MTQQQLQQEQFRLEQEKWLHLCYDVFKTYPRGAELLEKLKTSLMIESPAADPEKTDKHAFFREGQNSLVRSFVQNIKAYEMVMQKNAKKTEDSQ